MNDKAYRFFKHCDDSHDSHDCDLVIQVNPGDFQGRTVFQSGHRGCVYTLDGLEGSGELTLEQAQEINPLLPIR